MKAMYSITSILLCISLILADYRGDDFIIRIITNDLKVTDTLYAEYHRIGKAPSPNPNDTRYTIENAKLLYYNTMYQENSSSGNPQITDSLLVTDSISYAGDIPYSIERKICPQDYYSIEIDTVLTNGYYLDFLWVDSLTAEFLQSNTHTYYFESDIISCDIGGGLSVKVCSYDSVWTEDHFLAQFEYPSLDRYIPVDSTDTLFTYQFEMLDDRYEFCSYQYFWENLPTSIQVAIAEHKLIVVPLSGDLDMSDIWN